MSPASHRPRHREVGRVRLRTGRAGRAATVVGLAVLVGSVAAGTGEDGSGARQGGVDARQDVGDQRQEAVAAASGPSPSGVSSAADAPGVASRAVAAAALLAADGVESVRIAPDPPADLAALDAAVRTLRSALAADTARTADAGEVAAAEAAAGAAATPREAAAANPGTTTATPAPSTGVDAAAAEVFRLALAVERSLPTADPARLLPTGATPADPTVVAAEDPVAGLEQAAADAAALARALPAAGSRLGADLVGPGPARATPGMLRADGTVDPAVLCPVPFAPGALLRCDAVDGLVALNEVFRAEVGEDLPVGGTYRTYAEQVRLKAAKGGLAAEPGTSHHGWGVAVDFAGFGGVGEFDSPLFRWMSAHAPAFGWVHPAELGPGGAGPQEPWHWEFAGDVAHDAGAPGR